MPIVSVVMSVFNGERFLCQAIDSILSQTFTDFELTVIDDGSTDSTPALLERYQDQRLRVIRRENHGLAVSLQLGLELARGEFFARQDADDISLPQRLEAQLNYLERHSEVGVVGTGVIEIDEDGQFLGTKKLPLGDLEARMRLPTSSPLCHGSIMARTELLRRVGGYRLQFPDCEDRDLWLRVAECVDITNIPEALYLYRLHTGSVSAVRRKRQIQSGNLAVQMAVRRLLDGKDLFGHPYAGGQVVVPQIYAKQRLCLGVGLLQTGHFAIGARLILGALVRSPGECLFWKSVLLRLPKSMLICAAVKYHRWRFFGVSCSDHKT